MSDTVLGAVIGLVGVIIGSIGTLGLTWIREYYQGKREKEKLIYDLGKIYWQEALIKARESREPSTVYPLESFIISIKYLLEEISKEKLNENNIRDIISKHTKLVNIVKKHYDKES